MNLSRHPRADQTGIRTIAMPERLDRRWIESGEAPMHPPSAPMRLDFSQTRRLDSAGASAIHLLNRRYRDAGQRLILSNIRDDVRRTLESWSAARRDQDDRQQPDSPLVRIGDAGVAAWREGITALSVLVEMIYWGTVGLVVRRDIKRGALGEQMYQLGFKALGIVGLLAFLIGVVLALQTAMQLRVFGADIFLAPMIGISMIRELGPLMTAIILAGRTGSATTAEIATMGVQEELDALQTMSLNPIQFVVVPKFWAITLTMPMLSIIAVGAGIFGGYLVSTFYLQTASSLFWGELGKNIFMRDVMAGFIKSIVFSWLIIWIGAYYGFKVKGGAEQVGRETTASVVAGIFVIIVADAVFSFII
jgi:phospholipid/cholesterol/gamma-HCH transport system permease protein